MTLNRSHLPKYFVINRGIFYFEKEFSQSTDVTEQHFKTMARLGSIYIYIYIYIRISEFNSCKFLFKMYRLILFMQDVPVVLIK